MLGSLTQQLRCLAMFRSSCLVSRLPQLGLRGITTKQPTKSTAAAAKVDEFDDLDEQLHKQQVKQQQQEKLDEAGEGVPRQRWQATTTKYSVEEPKPLPVHTCETMEEREERLRTTYFQYAPDADAGHSLPPSEWKGVFHMFTRTQGMSPENIQLLRAVLDIDPRALKHHKDQLNANSRVEDQSLRMERLKQLGPDLAAAHFFVFRDCRIRFHGEDAWRCRDPDTDAYDLPGFKTPGLMLKDVDAANMNLVYEGLENMDGCSMLESINLSGSPNVDNWFVDRICYQHSGSLLSLDISHCPRITIGAITALARMTNLKKLNVTGLNIDHLALACLSLEDELPGLEVIGMDYEAQQTTLNEEQVEETYAHLKDLQSLKDGTFGKRR